MKRLARFVRSHPWLTGSATTVVAVVALGGWYAYDQTHVEDVPVSYAVPAAPTLTAASESQTLLRVDPLRSEVTYEVTEELAGLERTAQGSTRGIAGDLVIDDADPARSRLGVIVVNVAQFDSDEEMRDRRIRHDFLESGTFPLATFVPKKIDGLPAAIEEGTPYEITVTGDLTVKETAAPVTLDATVTRTGSEVRVAASTTVRLSTFDVGPIQLIGFVRTGDEARLTFDIVFVDPDDVEIATRVPKPGEELLVATGDVPSFRETVQPVLQRSCANCHTGDGIGTSVLALDRAADAAEVASALALATKAEYMPPWPASDESLAFRHDRSLPPEEIDAIVAWAKAGGPLDVDPETTLAPSDPPEPFTADITLRPDEPYTSAAHHDNDHRCVLLRPDFTEPTWVTGYQFDPDRDEILHHALAFRVERADMPTLSRLDRADPGTGWDCMKGSTNKDQFLGWAPGQDPVRYPDGVGLLMQPGDGIMLNIHYYFQQRPAPPDRSGMLLTVAPSSARLRPVEYRVLLAPAEIPCRPALERGPGCDRDTEIARIDEHYGIFGTTVPSGLLLQCGKRLEDVAVLRNGVARSDCDYVIGEPREAIGVFGHMHELGDTFRMTLNPGTPKERVILDIPTWDFGWQLDYLFEKPLSIAAGDTVRVECSWDRKRLTKPLARYVTWSHGTEDEMCYSALMLVPPKGSTS